MRSSRAAHRHSHSKSDMRVWKITINKAENYVTYLYATSATSHVDDFHIIQTRCIRFASSFLRSYLSSLFLQSERQCPQFLTQCDLGNPSFRLRFIVHNLDKWVFLFFFAAKRRCACFTCCCCRSAIIPLPQR